MTKLTRVTLVVGVLMALLVPPLVAQSGRGTLTGIVKDPSGAVVPDADVVVTNQDTGIVTRSVTTDAGVYRVPYVPPGKYRIAVSMAGFRTAVRENIEVRITEVVTVDFQLEVGQISDTVTVSGAAPLLETSSPEIGTVSTEKEVHTWPIFIDDGTRQLQTFIFNSMPGTQGGGWQGAINGSQSFSHEVLIDGISIGRMDINGGNSSEFTATVDAVSEFKLQTGSLSSQYGNTQTGLANFGMKSGTNTYHGSAFWFHQNSALNANSWATNQSGWLDPKTGKAVKAKTKLNNFGGTFGGPIVKDKTHFFASYEQNIQSNYNASASTDASPTAEMKRGDFSRLFNPGFTQDSRSGKVVGQDALGRDVIFGQIYDPVTSRQLSDGTWVRDPFPGNIIPQSRSSAVTKKILNPAYALPDPTFPRLNDFGQETLRYNTARFSGCCPELKIKNFSLKMDQVITDKHKLSGTFIENYRYRLRDGYGGSGYRLMGKIPNVPAAGDKKQSTPGFMIRLAEDWSISPTMLNHIGIGYNRFRNQNVSNSIFAGKDWAKELGLTNVGGATFPRINFSGPASVLSGTYKIWGHEGTGNEPNGSTIVQNDFTWIKGKHSLRFGGEHRRYYINSPFKDTPGSYTFDSEQTALPNFRLNTGFAFASFILGAVRNTSVTIHGITQGVRTRTTAFYAQDDWKVTDKLTLNLGLRWDIPTSYTNPNNFMSALDPKKPNPGADNYPGALVFLGDCSQCNGKTTWADIYYKQFGPRLGFAYAPTTKLVLRGGYGINYAPPLLDGWAFGWFNGFDGYNGIPQLRGRPGGANDPAHYWDNTYPKYTASLPNYDPTQLNGDYIPYYPPETNKMPMTQNWNFGVQVELPWETRLEVNYVATRGTRLNDGYRSNINQVDPKYLSLGDVLLESIDEHPQFKKPYPSFDGTVGQSLLPFPQYTGVSTHRLNEGWSNYHSMQLTATKRTSHGLSFLIAYTWSKALATTDDVLGYYGGYGQSIYTRKLDYAVSSLNNPHDLKVTWIYDLPFGPQGRWLRSGAASRILGGWTFSGLHRFSSGAPLQIVNWGGPDTAALFNNFFYVDTLLPRDKQIIGSKPSDPNRGEGNAYLNPAAWGPVPVTDNNVAKRLPNGVRWEPNLRGFARTSEQISLIKRTALGFREDASFEIRADMSNPLNRTWIADPETDISDPARFGRIFDKFGGGRTIQMGVRINF
ncbi:MAG: TonB-dependent receptor [Acidobacteria bacterium]|nr:TonB-dependent receptor [Acidobacteriota bacterium]